MMLTRRERNVVKKVDETRREETRQGFCRRVFARITRAWVLLAAEACSAAAPVRSDDDGVDVTECPSRDDCRISFSLSVTLDHVREKMNSMGHSKHGEVLLLRPAQGGRVGWSGWRGGVGARKGSQRGGVKPTEWYRDNKSMWEEEGN